MEENKTAQQDPSVLEKKDTKRKQSLRVMHVPFTQVANCVLNNPKLTARAKGIYAYLYSKPPGWDFNYVRMAKDHMETKNTILKAIQEIEKAGFLVRNKLPTGRIQYVLHYEPVTNPRAEASPLEEAKDQSTVRPKFGHISNKDKKVIKKKDYTPPEKPAVIDATSPIEIQIGETIDHFRAVNPNHEILFKRKPQRDACRRMLEKFGFDKIIRMIDYLPNSNRSKGAPVITTPCQFEEKLGGLTAWADRQRQGLQKSGFVRAVPQEA